MGLSEREQQLLDEMERSLYQSEADVLQTPASGGGRRMNLRSLVLGIVVVLVGVGVLIGGVAAQQLWLGLIGFAAMLGGALLAFSRTEEQPESVRDGREPTGSRGAGRRPAGENLSDRMARRWERRMDGEL